MNRKWRRTFWELAPLVVILAALVLAFGLGSKHFWSLRTFTTLANRVPTLAVLATGMTLVLIGGGIDLSVGSVLALAGAVVGVAIADWHWPLAAAMWLGVGVGLAAGLVNGAITVGARIPSFIVTLGMLELARGLSYMTTSSQTKYLGSAVEGLARPWGGSGLSWAVVIAAVVIVAAQLVLSRSVFGRHLVAVGTNPNATRLAGVNPGPVQIAVFAISGMLAGLGGALYASRLGTSDPNAGTGLELAAIAAVVIGGTSLQGGRGSVIHSFLGVLVVATLEAGLAQVGASEPTKRVVTGVAIVLAVLVDALRTRWSNGGFQPTRR